MHRDRLHHLMLGTDHALALIRIEEIQREWRGIHLARAVRRAAAARAAPRDFIQRALGALRPHRVAPAGRRRAERVDQGV